MNRMKGKKILAALGFFSIAGVAGGCSQPAPNQVGINVSLVGVWQVDVPNLPPIYVIR